MNGSPVAPSDIDFNRRGELSPNQARVVISMDYGTMLASVVPAVGAVIVLSALTSVALLNSLPVGLVALLIGAPACAAGAVWATRRIRARAASSAQTGMVRAVDGFVAWSGGQWTAFEAAAPSPRSLGPAPLPPGPFRFYRYAGTTVGAESPLGPGAYSIAQTLQPSSASFESMRTGTTRMERLPLGDPGMLQAALGQAGGFTAEDLAANRQGLPSPAQTSYADAAQVVWVQGPVQARWDMRGFRFVTVTRSLALEGGVIPVAPALADAVVPGLPYRIYRSATTGRVLSLEPVLE